MSQRVHADTEHRRGENLKRKKQKQKQKTKKEKEKKPGAFGQRKIKPVS